MNKMLGTPAYSSYRRRLKKLCEAARATVLRDGDEARTRARKRVRAIIGGLVADHDALVASPEKETEG